MSLLTGIKHAFSEIATSVDTSWLLFSFFTETLLDLMSKMQVRKRKWMLTKLLCLTKACMFFADRQVHS